MPTGFFGDLRICRAAGSRRPFLASRWKYSQPLVALEALCALMMLLCAVNTALLIVSRVSAGCMNSPSAAPSAPRGQRLISQVLIETALLACAGLALGGLLGWELAHALIAVMSSTGRSPGCNSACAWEARLSFSPWP